MGNFKEILSKLFLFNNISTEDIEKCCLFEGCEEKIYMRGDIMQSSSTDKKIGIILQGKAIILSGNDGAIIKKLEKDDIYGVAILFSDPTYDTKVVANGKCSVLTINKAFVERCINYNNSIAINYIEYLAKKIGFLNLKINAFSAKSTENKLYSYLRQMPKKNNIVILNSDFSAIAKMLGIGRASLYRAFEKLEKDGLIIRNKKEITLKEV